MQEKNSRAWVSKVKQYKLVTPVFGRQRQEDHHEFKPGLHSDFQEQLELHLKKITFLNKKNLKTGSHVYEQWKVW